MAKQGCEANLMGIWYNELGSEMHITQSEDGTLNGRYYNRAPDSYTDGERLIGSTGNATVVPLTFGFIVNFYGGKYTTAWSGQYYNECGKESLKTTWLMTTYLTNPELYWESTNVGQDYFTREPQKAKGRISLVSRHLDQMKQK